MPGLHIIGEVAEEAGFLFPANSSDGHLSRQVFARELKEVAARAGLPVSQGLAHMCFGMPSQATFWPVVQICGRFRNCSDIPISRPPKSTLMCSTNGSSSSSREHHPLAKPAEKSRLSGLATSRSTADHSVTAANSGALKRADE
jgi:hypothetical protein